MGVGVSLHNPAAWDPRNDSFNKMLGGPQGWSVGVQKIMHQPGFDLPTVQPITGRYTKKATLAYERSSEHSNS